VKASPNKRSAQAGFTLVEIAIVLVIIGLLLGGILKGQEMITNAKIKSVINDFNGVTAAVNSYWDRYRALPGDELSATTLARWGAAAFGGDGNVVLCPGACGFTPPKYNVAPVTPASGGPEPGLFWLHLRLAGFVPGPTTGIPSTAQPSNAANGIIGVQTTGMGFGSNIVCSSNLPDKIAIAVDTQMDDASAATGQVRGQVQAGTPNPAVSAAAPASPYAETGANQYLVCKSL